MAAFTFDTTHLAAGRLGAVPPAALDAGIVSDAIPAAIGGMPADAPPRPGTAKYDEYMRERERKRLLPASERGEETKPAPASKDPAR